MIIMIIGNYGMIIMIGSLEHQNYNREYPICGNEFWDTLLSENWIIYGTMVIESRHDDDRDSAAQDLEDGENPLDPVLSFGVPHFKRLTGTTPAAWLSATMPG